MKAIEVTARFSADGQITPLQVVWDDATFPVNQVGRRWQSDAGQHFLVMLPVEKIVELIFVPEEYRWYLHEKNRTKRLHA